MKISPRNPLVRLSTAIKTTWQTILSEETAWRGAAWGMIVFFLAAMLAFGIGMAFKSWALITVLALLVLPALLAFLSGALTDLLTLVLNTFPAFFRNVLAGCMVVLALLLFSRTGFAGQLILSAAVLLPGALVGAGIWMLVRGGWRAISPLRRGIALGCIVVGAMATAAGLAWYTWPGPPAPPVANAALLSGTLDQPLSAPDPSQPGVFPVKTLTYGSGADIHRPEYGAGVSLHTAPVDGSPFIDNWSGLSGALRTRYWGFDDRKLPLNGQVWYPEGTGPFPLVLIVHGNHSMMDSSDPGYAYLGELLASRGMIVTSVDENFLNSSWIDFQLFGAEGLKQENDARGWLLLEHLSQWRTWDQSPDNPFYQKVDLQRIALIGHSRGGEAAAIAAAFNRLPAYPDNANIRFDFNFNIRAVAAISPSDGQYSPSGRSTPLTDLNYFVLQGAGDSDVQSFQGIRQYNRVKFTGDESWFKAALYIGQANHGQFNSAWGRFDLGSGFPMRGLINTASLLSQKDQQQIAKVFLSAFLEDALKGQDGYHSLFTDPRAARAWLPDVVYQTRYASSRTTTLANFEEDLDVATASQPGITLDGDRLILWHEDQLDLKQNVQQSTAVFLGWDAEKNPDPARYTLTLARDGQRPASTSTLVFDLADASMDPTTGRLVPPTSEPLDLTIELMDEIGRTASLPLSSVMPLQPQIHYPVMKDRFLLGDTIHPGEPFLQVYEFPVSAFQAANPNFDASQIAALHFIFDRSKRGVVALDEIGFRE